MVQDNTHVASAQEKRTYVAKQQYQNNMQRKKILSGLPTESRPKTVDGHRQKRTVEECDARSLLCVEATPACSMAPTSRSHDGHPESYLQLFPTCPKTKFPLPLWRGLCHHDSVPSLQKSKTYLQATLLGYHTHELCQSPSR